MTRLPESAARRYGKVFDEMAAEYDRHRPTYPDENSSTKLVGSRGLGAVIMCLRSGVEPAN